jgi:N-methylhydantoinase A
MRLIGVDVGGTFTDLVYADTEAGRTGVHKISTTPDDPSRGVVAGLTALCDKYAIPRDTIDVVFHGTTIATNAILEHDGAVTGMITTGGYRDILHIGRHQRPQHYSIMQDIPWQAYPLAARRHRKVVTERVNAPAGEVETPLDEGELREVVRELREEGVAAVAVGFVNSYLNPVHEQRARQVLEEELPGVFITVSSDLFPQFREFERFTTTAINAFVGPRVAEYLRRLESALDGHGMRTRPHIMMSNGGMATVAAARRKPATLLMSGPAAGVLGGSWVGRRSGRERLITFDMGGTSADIGIATERGTVEAPARDTSVGGYPLLVPMLDLHTIGAGGGSVAYVDEGGAFHVGPRSAGSTPGPACYDRGGAEPTVTDAHVVLGRIDPGRFLDGEMPLSAEHARRAVQGLGTELGLSTTEAAEGVITVANNNMAGAVRERTVQRGLDPRDFVLVAFGGAGPLHAAELAELLEIPEVIVPPYPGITSAMGLLTTDLRYDLMRTVFMPHTEIDYDRLNADFREHERQLRAQLREDGVTDDNIGVDRSLDCRYVGQGYELRVDLAGEDCDEGVLSEAVKAFHAIHEREYGHCFPGEVVEIVNLRSTATGKAPRMRRLPPPTSASASDALLGSGYGLFRVDGRLEEMPVLYIDRWKLPADEPVTGPAVIFQRDTTTLVPPGWAARHGDEGTLFLTRRTGR